MLFEELNFGVVDAMDAVVPQDNYSNINVHHESLHLLKVQEIVEAVGGRVAGEHVKLKLKEEKNA